MPKRTATNLASLARGILKWAEAQGIDQRRLLEASELDPEDLEGADARIPHESHLALWRELAEAIGDPDFGLRSSESILSASSLGVVGLLAMTSPTVGESIRRSILYGRVLKEDVVARTYLTERTLVVELRPVATQPRAMAECSLAAFSHFMQLWSGETIRARQVFFQHARPADVSEYERVFPCPIHYGQPSNAILFDREVVEVPLTTSQPEVARYLDELASTKLAALEKQDGPRPDISSAIQSAVRAAAERGEVGLDTVARDLGMSARSLQRALAAHGLEYRRLVDQARWAIAGPLVATTDLPLEEVAERLGYADAKAFRRAFRRWSGHSPSVLRAKR
jgi:AraC-like DNA-binding protein